MFQRLAMGMTQKQIEKLDRFMAWAKQKVEDSGHVWGNTNPTYREIMAAFNARDNAAAERIYADYEWRDPKK